MIVDLMRNDLGRVCVTGSVRVAVAARRRAASRRLWHLVSTVAGRLRDDVADGDTARPRRSRPDR